MPALPLQSPRVQGLSAPRYSCVNVSRCHLNSWQAESVPRSLFYPQCLTTCLALWTQLVAGIQYLSQFTLAEEKGFS